MFVHPLTAADLVAQRRADLERPAARRRAIRQAAADRRTPDSRSVAEVLHLLAEALLDR